MLVNVEQKMLELNGDMELVRKELKRIQSVKCRLKKQKGKTTYESEMKSVLAEEQLLKEVRALIEPHEKPSTQLTLEDIKDFDYDQTMRAIRSIQSKKTLSQYLTEVQYDNDEYRNACKIEEMLLEHKKTVKPLDQNQIYKSQIQMVIETIESNLDLSNQEVIRLLQDIIK